jgi:hypothetical protein
MNCRLERRKDGVKLRPLLRTGAILIFVSALAANAFGAPITLTDKNSSATIDPNSQSGMSSWIVNNVNQLSQQWFWYRVGSAGPEASLDSLSLLSAVPSDTNGNGLNDTLSLRYGNDPTASAFEIDVTYGLQGTRAAGSSIGETINIKNNGSSPLDFHFYQYSDFDLGGTTGNDSEALLNPNTVRVVGDGDLFSETVVTRAADHYELALNPFTINRLNDANPTTLQDGSVTAGPGNVTWAFEWDQVLNSGDTLTISKNKTLQIPEPGTLALISIGLLGGLILLRKRS